MHKTAKQAARCAVTSRHWATALFDLTFAEPIRRAKVWSKYLLRPSLAQLT